MTSLISTALVSRPFVSSCNTTWIVETQYSICKIWKWYSHNEIFFKSV